MLPFYGSSSRATTFFLATSAHTALAQELYTAKSSGLQDSGGIFLIC